MSDYEKNDEKLSLDELLASAKSSYENAPEQPEDHFSQMNHGEAVFPSAPMQGRSGANADVRMTVGAFDGAEYDGYDPQGTLPPDLAEPYLRNGAASDDVLPGGYPAMEPEQDYLGENPANDYGDYDASASQPVIRKIRRPSFFKKIRFPRILILAIYLALVIGLGVLIGRVGWKLADDALALTRPDVFAEITIDDNDDLNSVTAKLKEVGAVRYEWLFKLYCKISKNERFFDPGVYSFKLSCDYHALVNNLMASAGTRETITLMIAEGQNAYDIYDLLEKNGVCTREKLEEAAANYEFDYEFLERLPYGETNRLEGFLFPDTYQFYLMDEPQNVLGRLLRNYQARLTEEDLKKIQESKYTMRQILTMASIVEAEAGRDDERAKIASVMFNRLDNWENPLLGMDSTVYYGAKLLGEPFSISVDSPYNTYKYPGLPVGPICNPGLNSIRAVLYPEDTEYYYFATGIDGRNHFFETEEDFNSFINSDEFKPITPGVD